MKKKKEKFVDDGRTIADMDYEHITGYKSKSERKKHNEIRSLNLSKQERRAIYKRLSLNICLCLFAFFSLSDW